MHYDTQHYNEAEINIIAVKTVHGNVYEKVSVMRPTNRMVVITLTTEVSSIPNMTDTLIWVVTVAILGSCMCTWKTQN